MSGPTLKVTPSSLSKGTAARGDLKNYSAQLQALDRNGDGQLDLDEVCDAIDEIVKKQKTEKTLKWLLAALALFSLLTIAATVGLTYAVVVMSKDTEVNGPVLQSKDTGEALRTGSFLQSQNATALVNAVTSADDPSAALARVTSIKVPSLKEGEAYTVHKVDAITMLLNNSVLVRTATGMNVLMPVASLVGAAEEAANATETTQVPGRKLLETKTYTIKVVQGSALGGRPPYTFPGVAATATIADVIAFFSPTNNPPADAPSDSLVKLKATSAGTVLASTTVLQDIPSLLTATAPTLYMDTRSVSLWFRATSATGASGTAGNVVYVPVGDTWGGVKREAFVKYGKAIADQTICKFGTSISTNNCMKDDDAVSTLTVGCSLTDCSVYDYLSANIIW